MSTEQKLSATIEDGTVIVHLPGCEPFLQGLRDLCTRYDLPHFEMAFPVSDAQIVIANNELIATHLEYVARVVNGKADTSRNLRCINKMIRELLELHREESSR
jgi:hypothetical protein